MAFLRRAEALDWGRIVFEKAPLAVSLRDVDLRLLWANPAYEQLLGRTVEEMAGREIFDILQADEHPGVAEVRGRFDASYDAVSFLPETAYERPDGSLVYADVSVHYLHPHDGEPPLVVSFLDDATHRVNLARRHSLDELVASISTRLANVDAKTIDGAVIDTLAELGTFFGVASALIERRSDQLTPRVQRWPNDPHHQIGAATLSCLTALGPATSTVRYPTDEPGVGSVISTPVATQDHVAGLVVLMSAEARRWEDDERKTLTSIAALLAGAQARVEAQVYFAVAFDDAPVGISLRRFDSTLLAANQAYANFLGFESVTDMLGAEAARVLTDGHHDTALTLPQRVRREGSVKIERMEFLRTDGTVVCGRVHAKRVMSFAGGEELVLSHVEDVTDSTNQERALANSQRRFQDLVENSPAMTILLDADLRITYSSPSIAQIGWAPSDLVGNPIDSISDNDAEGVLRELRHVIEQDEARAFDWCVQTPLGEQWLHLSAVPEHDSAGAIEGVIIVAVDDTERHRSQAELRHQARHDSLTGLSNRPALLEHVQAHLDQGTEVAVLFLDLDRFKVVNDSLGHSIGDELVAEVARRLRATLREATMVARLGGDEFVVVITSAVTQRGASEERAVDLARRLQAALTPVILLDGQELYVTASIGVAFADSGDVEHLIADADAAMYQAKAAGRNRIEVFSLGLERVPAERITLEAELRRALPRGEFEAYFQPEVDLTTGTVLGAEALVRWHHPQRGLLTAGLFIEIAEECGLITDIGEWMLSEACRVAGRWQRNPATAHLIMRVNLSARQLSQRDIVERVVQAIETFGADPAHLCLEITETVLMADAEASLDVLARLRALGVSLAIDDFGTGYSSLSYLKRFPVDILKIDRSFVSGLPHDHDDFAIARSIVGLATALGLDLVAEGVETVEQVDALLALGCERAQGYLFAKPMSLSELEAGVLGRVASDHARRPDHGNPTM